MKKSMITILSIALVTACNQKPAEVAQTEEPVQTVAPAKHLYMDVHNLEPGKVKFEDVAGAHQKDLATQDKYNANFIKYWVDEAQGKVYCLVEAPDSAAVSNTHKEAHGLVPNFVGLVSDGPEAPITDATDLYFDVHYLGAGKVTAAAVADAHNKDLAVQSQFGVNFINYWVDEKAGTVVCLSEAHDSKSIIAAHTKAHGLVPQEVHKVTQGE